MINKDSFIRESRKRLDHLRSMPETPSRSREILALERAISETAKQPEQKATAVRRARQKIENYDPLSEYDEIIDKPLRRVVHEDGHRRVIISTPQKNKNESEAETRTEMHSREHWKRDLRATLGHDYQGMS